MNVALHRRMIRMTMLVAMGLVWWLVFFQVPAVEAHAVLQETVPGKGQVTETPPKSLKLTFNEPIEQELASVTVYDWNARPVLSGQPDGEDERSKVLEFTLPELEEGTYNVQWSVVSLDGHPVSGSFFFAVGKATEGGVKTVSGGGGSEKLLIVTRTVVEGLLLLGAGLYWFAWLAEKRGYPGIGTLIKRGRHIGATVLLIGTLSELVTYAVTLPAGLPQTILKGRWDLLLQFPFVLMLFGQLFLIIMLILPDMVRGWYLGLWLLLAAVPSFGGHVWGMEQPFVALIPRIFHQLAIALWLGALLYVILLHIWKKRQGEDASLKAFRPFFVQRMVVTSGLVILSGVIMVLLQTGWKAIFTDWRPWNTLLLLKVIFTIFMLSLALFQTLKWRKQGSFSTPRLIRVEWLAGLAVIFFGVWMSQIPYPLPIKSYASTLTADQLETEVKIDILQPGEQTMHARIPDLDGDPPDRVTVDMGMPQHGMHAGPFTGELTDAGIYEVALEFSMSGSWHITIRAEYPGGEEKEWKDVVFIVGDGG